MFVDKIVELNRDACVHGLPVSISFSHLNGREIFCLTSIPGQVLTGRPEYHHGPWGDCRRRGREYHKVGTVHPADAKPSYPAVARSPTFPLAWCIPNHALWLDTSANFARLAYSTMDAVAESANAEQTTFMDVATSAIQRAVGILGYPIAAAAEAPNFLYAAEEAVKVN